MTNNQRDKLIKNRRRDLRPSLMKLILSINVHQGLN